MAFRSEAKACARVVIALAVAMPLLAQTLEYQVRHRHLRNGGEGTLRFSETGLSFEEPGKRAKHSRQWTFDDIQLLTLEPNALRIVTYEDQRGELGRDRVYLFDHLPAALAKSVYPIFSRHLDRRFVAALADEQVKPDWQLPVKLTRGRFGSQGLLLFAADKIVYATSQAGESRTWRTIDLENISSADPFDLTVTTHERAFRFQLKQELPEGRFQQLWLRVNQTNGLQIFTSNNPTGESK